MDDVKVEKKAQAKKTFGKQCKLPADAPDYLKQTGNTANPELVAIIQGRHRQTLHHVRNTNGSVIYKDSGC